MKKISNIIVAVTFGLATVLVALAFSGPGTRTPGTGNPDFWIKNVNDIYYNPAGGGNVGIGTANPNSAYKLDVQGGKINTSDGLCIAGICKADWNEITGTSYWTLNGSSLYPNQTSYILGVGTASLDSNYKITIGGGGIKAESTNQPAGYFSSASGYGLIVNSGNVGIGTTSPEVKLHVVGGSIHVQWDGVSENGIIAQNYGPTTYGSGAFDSGPVKYFGNTLRFITDSKTNLLAGSRPVRMTISENGNVGIGTASPGTKLEVVGGSIKATGGLIIETRTSDPASPVPGQIWLRTDL